MRPFFFFTLIPAVLLGAAIPAQAKKTEASFFFYGAPEAREESRISSDGVLQPFPGTFTLTPLLEVNGRWISRKDFSCGVYFERPSLPIPNVICNDPELRLEIKSFVQQEGDKGRLLTRYQIRNKSPHPLEGNIYFLLQPARDASLRTLEFSEEGQSIRVNEKWQIYLSPEVSEAGFFKGLSSPELDKKIKHHEWPQIHSVKDSDGKASGVWAFSFQLKPGKRATFGAIIPFDAGAQPPSDLDFRRELGRARAYWIKKKGTFDFLIRDSALSEIFRIQLASLLIARDAPGIYSDDFGRDTASTGQVLELIQTYLRFGWLQEAREDLEMVSLRQDPSGSLSPEMKPGDFPPGTKDYRLQGQFAAAVLSYYEFSRDKTWLEAKWPLVKNALEYLKYLRLQRVTGWYAAERPELRRFYGILPPSGSEETFEPGRLGKRHWYADDFWALRGWKDGRAIAEILEKDENEIRNLKDEETLLRRSLFESIELTAKNDNAAFIPAAAEKSFFDAALGALAVWPAEEEKAVTASRLNFHFENTVRLYKKESQIQNGKADEFSSFSVIQAMLRRGEKDHAWSLFRFRLKNLREEDFLQAAGFARTLRDFAVYEDAGRLVLAAGVLPEWIGVKKPFSVRLPTRFGEMIYSIQTAGKNYRVKVSGDARPPEGFIIKSPSGSAEQVFQRVPIEFDLAA